MPTVLKVGSFESGPEGRPIQERRIPRRRRAPGFISVRRGALAIEAGICYRRCPPTGLRRSASAQHRPSSTRPPGGPGRASITGSCRRDHRPLGGGRATAQTRRPPSPGRRERDRPPRRRPRRPRADRGLPDPAAPRSHPCPTVCPARACGANAPLFGGVSLVPGNRRRSGVWPSPLGPELAGMFHGFCLDYESAPQLAEAAHADWLERVVHDGLGLLVHPQHERRIGVVSEDAAE